MAKWLDNDFIPRHQNLTDKNILDKEVWEAPCVFAVRVNSEKKGIKAKNAWTNFYTTDTQGCKYLNIYTNFETALNECRRLEHKHPDRYMRVERLSLASILDDSAWIGRFINVYGETCYICDGKKAYPDDYWKRWPNHYPTEAKEHVAQDNEEIHKNPIGFRVPEMGEDKKEEESEAKNGY